MVTLEPSSITDSEGNVDSIVGDTAPLPPPLNSPFSYLLTISFKVFVSIPSIPEEVPPLPSSPFSYF